MPLRPTKQMRRPNNSMPTEDFFLERRKRPDQVLRSIVLDVTVAARPHKNRLGLIHLPRNRLKNLILRPLLETLLLMGCVEDEDRCRIALECFTCHRIYD